MLKPEFLRMSARSGCCEPNPNTPERAVGLNQLDSRAIGRASCFAQRFMRPGTYEYAIVPGYGHALAAEFPFRVVVEDSKSEAMTQHNVLVREGKQGLEVDQPEVRIRLGDMVLWSGNGRTTSAFAVAGEQPFFNSHRMVNECGYSHAFGTPGDYRWVDAFGSGLQGTIRVRDAEPGEKGLAEWRRRLNEGMLVMIAHGNADRPEVDIMVGQTVFFAVIDGPGISVTDERLVELGRQAAATKAA